MRARGHVAVLAASLAAAAALTGCTVGPHPSGSLTPYIPPSPEALGTPVVGDVPTLTCGGRSFPASGLEAPGGAEKAAGPEFDALRVAVVRFGAPFPSAPTWSWRLAGRDQAGAIFLTQSPTYGWVSVEVTTDGSAWEPASMGQCTPHAVISSEYRPATWSLDPDYPSPTAASTVLHVIVWEMDCSGGLPATGRISAPLIRYTTESVTITIGVRPVAMKPGDVVTCPGVGGSAATLQLSEPLGARTLLDGGVVPAAPPSPRF